MYEQISLLSASARVQETVKRSLPATVKIISSEAG